MKRHVPLKLPVVLFCLLRMTTCLVYYFEAIYVEKGVLGFKTISGQNLLCIRQRYAIDVYDYYVKNKDYVCVGKQVLISRQPVGYIIIIMYVKLWCRS